MELAAVEVEAVVSVAVPSVVPAVVLVLVVGPTTAVVPVVEPEVGVVVEGAVVVALLTVTDSVLAVARLPAASRTTALSVCVPFVTSVVFHVVA